MVDVRFSNATNAYQDALRAAERIISQSKGGTSVEESKTSSGPSFIDMVGSALQSAQNAGFKSEDVANRSLTGKASLTDVITAVSNAENALQTVVAVRDKVINAYQDIIRMPI